MLNKDYETDSQFVPLVDATEYEPRTTYTYVVRRHKKKMCSGCCLFVMCTLFLCLFFMLPRHPEIHYKSSSITGSPQDTYHLTQKFAFSNNNYYKMEWSDLNLEVFLCQVSGTFPFWQLNCVSDPVGEASYKDGGQFHTDARETVNVDLDYTLDLDVQQLEVVANLCLTFPYQVVFLSVGSVHAELSNGHSFGEMDVNQLAYVDCS
jgi:hypothetical protein